ncbi:MAG: hypothetical protein FWC95_04575 [Defluviitaleaceae bacterium]|nr:hypothetical protein [Defluviitaleaceae bacterium]
MDHKNLNLRILNEFALPAAFANTARRDKWGIACEHNGTRIIIQKPRGGKDNLIFAHYVKENLIENGFEDIDRYYIAASGLPYCEIAGDVYTVAHAPYIGKYTETDFANIDAVSEVAAKIGQLHNLVLKPQFFADFTAHFPHRKDYDNFTGRDGLAKQLKTMQGYKKIVKRQSRLSDFDVLFLKNFNAYDNAVNEISEIIDGLNGSNLSGFCHNMIKEEAMLKSGGILYVTGFDESSADSFMFDLAQIITRYIRMSGRLIDGDLHAILDTYNNRNPLSNHDLRFLYAVLLFPGKFYKTCVKYYSKKRTWTPASFTSAFAESAEYDESVIQTIKKFFNKY